jgi:ubiquitin-protein ligase
MATRMCQKRLSREILMYSKDNFQFVNLILRPHESNILRWYFIIHDLQDTPYDGGVYFGKVVLPRDYPFKAPDFYFITPNGRFETDTKICTTFSSFHQETYTSTWNVFSLMQGLISYMTDAYSEHGVGSVVTTIEDKKQLAEGSLAWNSNNPEFSKVFPDFADLLKDSKN